MQPSNSGPESSPDDLSQLSHFTLGDLLSEAAESGTLADVQRLLTAGADPDHRHGPDELTPLMLVTQRNAADIVDALINAGADVNETIFEEGLFAAVTFAAIHRHKALYTRLKALTSPETLEDTAPWAPYQKSNYDKRVTALVKAARTGNLARLHRLLDTGADLNALGADGITPLVAAAQAGHLEIVEQLLASGARADLQEPGKLPLYNVITPEIIRRLIAAGAAPNGPAGLGSSPLAIAAITGRVPEAQALLQSGANVNRPDEDGKTPLGLAAERGHVEMIQVLVSAGADLNARTPNGRTPLLLSLKYPTAVQMLLELEADPNSRTKDGQTALMRAPTLEITQILLAAGANPNLADESGRPALMLNRNLDIAAALLAAGSRIEAQDHRGRTALMYAANRGDALMTEFFLNAGADPTSKDTEGNDAIALAHLGFISGLDRILPLFHSAAQRIRHSTA